MSTKTTKGRADAVAVHDGQAWRLFWGRDLCEASAPTPAPVNRLPQSFVDVLVQAECRRVRFLVSGDVHRMEGAIPSGMSLDKANAVIRSSMAETTGVETDGLVVAGRSMSWGGVRKPFTLACGFDGDWVADVHATLSEAGLVCGGFASLELAMLATWKPARDASLVVVDMGTSFVVPAPRGANPGPQTIPCGLRHFQSDAANGLARFQRAAATIGKDAPLHLVVLGGADLAATFAAAGYVHVIAENGDGWLRAAVRAVLLAKPNRTQGVSIPVANPYEPRKRFSQGWIVAASLAILALPAAFRLASAWQTERNCRQLAAAAAPFRPLEKRIEQAKKALSSAEAEFAREQTAQRSRIAARRPLVAFVDVAYYFCKHAGSSLTLDAIEQNGNRIDVRGTFSDPEDGVALNRGLLDYARRKNMEVVKNEFVNESAGDAAFVNRFVISLDCARVGEEGAK